MSRSRNWDKARARERGREAARVKENPATEKQLRLLRYLARRTGSSFDLPISRWRASVEIERLEKLRRTQL